MAQTLPERIKAAKSPRARIADIENTIIDAKAELERAIAQRDRSAAESIDFALSEADRDAAAATAERQERNAKALAKEIGELDALLFDRQNSDRRKEAEAVRAEALAERDILAARFKDEVPTALETLVTLFAAVVANTERLRSLHIHELSAEEVARGVHMRGIADDAESYVTMRIPHWDQGGRRMWPIEQQMQVFDYGRAILSAREQDAKRVQRQREAAEEHRRTHGRYQLACELSAYKPVIVPPELRVGLVPDAVIGGFEWEGEIPHEAAEMLRSVKHLSVTALDTAAV